jgi:hypothetical protein
MGCRRRNRSSGATVPRQHGSLAGQSKLAVSNATFPEKCKVYKDSGYSVTNQVANYSKWTMDEIRDRQIQLAKIAVKTWSQRFAD